jgi:hypothetical protein
VRNLRLTHEPRRIAIACLLLIAALAGAPATSARTNCSFTLGFKALHDLIPEVVGDCTENEQADPSTGNLTQRTANGLLMWRKSDNWTAFTDGPSTYIARDGDIVSRPTDASRLAWEGDAPAPAPPNARSTGAGSESAVGPTTVLFQDDFDDPNSPECRKAAEVPGDQHQFACTNGEYRVSGVLTAGYALFLVPGRRYSNTSVAVDARLVSGFEQRQLMLFCRENDSHDAGYLFTVSPSLQRFTLGKRTNGEWDERVRTLASDAIKPGGEVNRLELICSGDTITARANGVDLTSIRDTTYRSGWVRLGAVNSGDVPLPVDARFDNLVMSER